MYYKNLGYRYYQEYIDGPEWEEIKEYFYKYCGDYRCGICGRKFKLLLHKRSYEYLTMEALRQRFIFRFLIVRYLKKYMVWLCFSCNNLVHFDDDGNRIELHYPMLLNREKNIYKRYNSIWSRLRRKRPSEFFNLFAR